MYISNFVFHSVSICQLHAHTCPLYNVLLEVVCCSFPRLFKHSYVRQVTELLFVSASVSEIRELNQNKVKKNSEIGYFPFLGI